MHPDRFDTRVKFETRQRVPNGGGGHSVIWNEMGGVGSGSRWVALWPVAQSRTDEEVGESQVANAPDYRLIARSDSDTITLSATDRVLIDGEPYAIKSLARPDRGRGTISMIVQAGQPT